MIQSRQRPPRRRDPTAGVAPAAASGRSYADGERVGAIGCAPTAAGSCRTRNSWSRTTASAAFRRHGSRRRATYLIRVGGWNSEEGDFPLDIGVSPPQILLDQIQVAGLGAVKSVIDVEGLTGNGLLLGVVHLDGRYYVSGGNSGANPNTVFVIDDGGSLVGSFPQVSTTTFGYRDGATDGASVMFGCEDGIYVHDPAGAVVTSVLAANGPQTVASPIAGAALQQLNIYRGLAYDPKGNNGNGSFWTATFGSDLLECDLAGNVLTTLPNNAGWSIYGIAWDPYTGTLLVNSYPNAGDLAQIDPATGDVLRTIPRAINPGSSQGGLSPALSTPEPGNGANSRDGSWDVVGLDQTTPDTIVRYRIHLWRNKLRNGFEEGRLLTAAGANPLNAAPVKVMNAGSTISLQVEPLPQGRLPALFLFNTGQDALVNGDSKSGKSNMFQELVALTHMSNPTGAFVQLMGMTGTTLTIPTPVLRNMDYLRAQAMTINPAGHGAFAATNQMFFQFTDCLVLENFDALATGTGNYPNGWSDGGGAREWQVRTGTTPSGGTGPTGAVSQPNYMYCETSSPAVTGDTYIMNTSVYPSAGMTSVSFQLSRVGATIGTLELRMDDGSGTFSTVLASYTGPEPNGVVWTEEVIALPTPLPANVQFQFHYVRGTSFTGDIAIDEFCIE